MDLLTAKLLTILEVKHTRYFLRSQESKETLNRLEKLLSVYRFNTLSTRLTEEDLAEIPLPAVVYLQENNSGKFEILQALQEKRVHLWSASNKYYGLERTAFLQQWSGVTLLIEKTEETAEPNYAENLRQQRLQQLKNSGLVGGLLAITLFAAFACLSKSPLLALFPVLELAGIGLGVTLLQEQFGSGHQGILSAVCLLGSKQGCNSVLRSAYGKWRGFSLSQVVLFYFTARWLVLLAFPESIGILAILSLLVLPLTLWSLYVQSLHLKQWCGLCLLTVALLWAEAALTLVLWPPPFSFSVQEVAQIVMQFALVGLVSHSVFQWWLKSLQFEPLKQRFLEIKDNPAVFEALHYQQPAHETGHFPSDIVLGNMESEQQLLVVISPKCSHCGTAFRQLQKIAESPYSPSIRLRFHSPDDVSVSLLAAIHQYGSAEHLLAEWYAMKPEESTADYLKARYPVHQENRNWAKQWLTKTHQWIRFYQIATTPFILLNGKPLPTGYSLKEWWELKSSSENQASIASGQEY